MLLYFPSANFLTNIVNITTSVEDEKIKRKKNNKFIRIQLLTNILSTVYTEKV